MELVFITCKTVEKNSLIQENVKMYQVLENKQTLND
jgi:hypothetical protein